mmetsp:Transcript_9453/g.30867  ORF Transcript_9453/g.30867 Transcript_9453/m.30867 type:complete len:298 (-) Transcript_9453:223-1116(-)
MRPLSVLPSTIRAVSFDVTGTLVVHRHGVSEAYANCAAQSRMTDPPTAEELKPAFKAAWREVCEEMPCFGFAEKRGGRNWWKHVVRRTLDLAGRTDVEGLEFERFFRRVYQHYGSEEGYEVLPDVVECLEGLGAYNLSLGVTSNTATRTIETTLPLTKLAPYFDWFVCSADVGFEKPHRRIFDDALRDARFWLDDPTLAPENMLHVGDNLVCDYMGAKAAGFQALYLDRVDKTTNYQDWLVGPDYPGKSEDDIQKHTIRDLSEIIPVVLAGQQLEEEETDDDDDLIIPRAASSSSSS